MEAVCDGVEVAVVPQGLSLTGPSRSISRQMGHCVTGHLLTGGDKRPSSKSRGWYPPLMGTCVGLARAWSFPGVSSGSIPQRGCLGTRLCSSMVLCLPPPQPLDGVSELGEAELLPLALSLCSSWVGATVTGFSAC